MQYLILFLSIFSFLQCGEFLYPVTHFQQDGTTKIYVIYQKNIAHLELWSVDIENGLAYKALMSTYNPAGIKILPDQSGFSFIDNGRIRVKYFNKRSPTNFEFDYPIYSFHSVDWLNNKLFYFSAKAANRFCIFLCNTDTKSTKSLIGRELCSRTNDDFMYPQIIGGKIFFISKSVHKLSESHYETFGNYKIMCTKFDAAKYEADQKLEVVLRRGEHAMAFLKMISETEGFFLGHPNKVSKHETIIHLKYFNLKYIDGEWQYKKLFDFNIPLKFLIKCSDERLYESILPFLPRHENNKIYYCSCNSKEDNFTNVFEFDIENRLSKQLTKSTGPNSCFSPLKIGDKLFFGGSITEQCKFQIDENDDIKILLPNVVNC